MSKTNVAVELRKEAYEALDARRGQAIRALRQFINTLDGFTEVERANYVSDTVTRLLVTCAERIFGKPKPLF